MYQDFNDYTIVKEVEKKYNQRRFVVCCKICGHEKICSLQNLKKQNTFHSELNCKYDFYKKYIGQKFGDFVCTDIQLSNKLGYIMTLKCDTCGQIITRSCFAIISRNNIPHHTPATCKDMFGSDYIGKMYGDFKVIQWLCDDQKFILQCQKCGEKTSKTLRSLKINNSISHGIECFKAIPQSVYKKAIQERLWNIKQRCNNINNSNYQHYGQRNIKVHYEFAVDLYHDFINEFIEKANQYGLSNATFDRIDVNGDYCKNNLRITTMAVQNTNNTRRKFYIIQKGEERVLIDSCMHAGKILGLNGRALGNVVRGNSKSTNGWQLVKKIDVTKETLSQILKSENVTTNLIISL